MENIGNYKKLSFKNKEILDFNDVLLVNFNVKLFVSGLFNIIWYIWLVNVSIVLVSMVLSNLGKWIWNSMVWLKILLSFFIF